MWKKILPGLVITASVVLAIASVWGDSLIVDEIPHIGAGYSYLVKQDMRINPEHPPLAKDLAAIPLLFIGLNQTAFNTPFWQENVNGQWDFGRDLIFQSGNNANLITHLAKLPMLIFFILAAWLLYHWLNRRYGFWPALFGLVMFAFSPTILAHSRFVTTDVPALWGVLTASFFFFRYLEHPSRKNLIIAGLIFGVAQLTKFSVFLLVPFFILAALLWIWASTNSWRERSKIFFATILIMAIGYIVVVWPVYGFHVWNYPVAMQQRDMQAQVGFASPAAVRDVIIKTADIPYWRAFDQYLFGLLMVNQRQAGGNTIYFEGKVSQSGGPTYFPIVYFIKETLVWWLATALALLALVLYFSRFKQHAPRFKHWCKENFVELAMVLWLLIYWGISIQSKLNIGVRHLLPTYPFAVFLVSVGMAYLIKRSRNYGSEISGLKSIIHYSLFLILVILMAGQIYLVSQNYPYFLTYFNESVGGPSNAYKTVVDSNLDWGQDLKRLGNFVADNKINKIEVDYFGWADPLYYLKDHVEWLHAGKYRSAFDFKHLNHSDGWLAVSATFKQNSKQNPATSYDWLDAYQPVATVGNSIFVYHIK